VILQNFIQILRIQIGILKKLSAVKLDLSGCIANLEISAGFWNEKAAKEYKI